MGNELCHEHGGTSQRPEIPVRIPVSFPMAHPVVNSSSDSAEVNCLYLCGSEWGVLLNYASSITGATKQYSPQQNAHG